MSSARIIPALRIFAPSHSTPLLARVQAALEVRRQRRALAALDDHLLKDIGVTRAQVHDEVHRPIWRVTKGR